MNHKVSIIIPCYNVEKYISQCIESIINQTYKNLEIICINDGSSDETQLILEKYIKLDSRIILSNQSNKGLSDSRSSGVEISSGEYILFVDSDDWLETDCIDFLMKKQIDYDIICFSYFRDFKNISLPRKLGINGIFSASYLQRRILGPVQDEIKNIGNLDALVTVWGKLYKSDKIKGKKFVDVTKIGTWEDGLFNFEILEQCDKVLIMDEPFYHYRKDNIQSFTSKSKIGLYKKWLNKFEILSTLIIGKNNEFHTALKNRIAISLLGLTLTEVGNEQSINEKFKNLKIILSTPLYKNAINQLEISLLPLHWKLFYGFAKRESVLGVYSLAKGIQFIQKIKNL